MVLTIVFCDERIEKVTITRYSWCTDEIGAEWTGRTKPERQERTEEHHDDAKADDALTTRLAAPDSRTLGREHPFSHSNPFSPTAPTRSAMPKPILPRDPLLYYYPLHTLVFSLYWSEPSDPLCQTSNTLRLTCGY